MTLSLTDYECHAVESGIPEYETDWAPAWDAAMADMGPVQDGNYYNNVGKTLRIPEGTYYFSRTVHVSRYCIVEGDGYGSIPPTQPSGRRLPSSNFLITTDRPCRSLGITLRSRRSREGRPAGG